MIHRVPKRFNCYKRKQIEQSKATPSISEGIRRSPLQLQLEGYQNAHVTPPGVAQTWDLGYTKVFEASLFPQELS